MRKLIFILIVLLILFSFGMVVLYGASGHSVNFKNVETLIYLLLVFLYSLTALILLIFNYKKKVLIKNVSIASVFLTIISFSYLFYEIFKIKIGDFFALIPIMMMIIILFLSVRILYYLLNYKVE
jgi:hypothetical protein